MIRLGLIGTGRFAQNYIKTIAQFPNIELAAVCNASGIYSNYKCFNNWRELLEQKYNGIIIAANPSIHIPIIQMANSLDIPVLVEKPLALSLNDALTLRNTHIPILVDYIHLFAPAFLKLKKLINSTIQYIYSYGINNGPIRDYSSLYDYGPHDLSMCIDVLNSNKLELKYSNKLSTANGNIYDMQFISNKTEVIISIGNGGTNKIRKLIVHCENNDTLIYDDTSAHKLLYNDEPIEIDPTPPLTNVLSHFIDVIENKMPVRPKLDLTFQITDILSNVENATRSPK
jgi:predicted dehydrogenase